MIHLHKTLICILLKFFLKIYLYHLMTHKYITCQCYDVKQTSLQMEQRPYSCEGIMTVVFPPKVLLNYLSKALRWELQSHHKESEEYTQLPQSLHLNYGLQEEKLVIILQFSKSHVFLWYCNNDAQTLILLRPEGPSRTPLMTYPNIGGRPTRVQTQPQGRESITMETRSCT